MNKYNVMTKPEIIIASEKLWLKLFRAIPSILLAACMIIQSGCLSKEPIHRLSDESRISFQDMIADTKHSRLVFIGEVHEIVDHHRIQLEVIRGLHEQDVPIAIGMEMFQADYQDDLDRWVQGSVSEEAFSEIYLINWSLPWEWYRDIFLYAREHGIPLVGLNVSPAIVRQVARQGFASLSEEQLGKLPGVSCNVDPSYREFIMKALRQHGKDEKTFTYFCEAQMVWDTTMAWNVMKYAEENPQTNIVVLAGNGHAWKQGIPEQIRRQNASITSRIILPELPRSQKENDYTVNDADYIWMGR